MKSYLKNGLLITSMSWEEYQKKKKAQYEKWKKQSDYRLWSNNDKNK